MPPARFSLPPRTVSTEPAPTVRTVPRADGRRGAPSPPDHHPTTTWGRRQSHQAVVPEGTIGQSVSARGRPVATLSVHIAAASTREVQLWSRVGAARSCGAPRCYVPAADSCSGGSRAAREPGSVAGPRRARRHLAHQLPNPPGPQLASRPAPPNPAERSHRSLGPSPHATRPWSATRSASAVVRGSPDSHESATAHSPSTHPGRGWLRQGSTARATTRSTAPSTPATAVPTNVHHRCLRQARTLACRSPFRWRTLAGPVAPHRWPRLPSADRYKESPQTGGARDA